MLIFWFLVPKVCLDKLWTWGWGVKTRPACFMPSTSLRFGQIVSARFNRDTKKSLKHDSFWRSQGCDTINGAVFRGNVQREMHEVPEELQRSGDTVVGCAARPGVRFKLQLA